MTTTEILEKLMAAKLIHIGEDVYYMNSNEIRKGVIDSYVIHVGRYQVQSPPEVELTYRVKGTSNYIECVDMSKVFRTTQELIDNLLKNIA